MPLWMRHQTEGSAGRVADARDRSLRTVRIGREQCAGSSHFVTKAQDNLPGLIKSSQYPLRPGDKPPFAMCDWDHHLIHVLEKRTFTRSCFQTDPAVLESGRLITC